MTFGSKSLGGTLAVAIGLLLMAANVHAITIQTTTNPIGGGAGTFNEPVFVTHAGDTRLFVVQHAGRIRIISFPPATGTVLATDFLNLGVTVGANIGLGRCTDASGGGERGCLGLAFHPQYAIPATPGFGKFYVCYTDGPAASGNSGNIVIAQYSVSGNPDIANTTETVILRIPHTFAGNHNGGCINFGPDGYLYISVGDGGGANDTGAGHNAAIGNAQDLTQLLGKMLRLDINNDDFPADPNKNYAIPLGNPFSCTTGTEAKEIWAYGLRNVWRWSFDRGTGELYAGDVGQNAREEVDIITLGGNYGWRCLEGGIVGPNTLNCTGIGYIDPIHDYDRTQGQAITGGYVYRGTAFPALNNLYFFADYSQGRIWTLDGNCATFNCTSTLRRDETFPISSFGQGSDAELYICAFSGATGAVYKITDSDAQPAVPTPSPSMTPSPSPSVCPTLTPSPTPSPTPTLTPSPTASLTASPTPSPSISPTASPTPTASLTATASPTASQTATPTPTASPSMTQTATPTASQTVTATPSASPSPNATIDWEVYQ